MTTSKRQIAGGGTERPPAKPAGQRPEECRPAATNRWYQRVSFWRAVAGMAFAIALGCAAIALETVSELSSRTANFHRRLELLGSRFSRLHTQTADAERQVDAMRAEQLARANINRVLSAADVVLLRLTPPAGSKARGLVALSRQTDGAIIEITGLPAAAGQTCVMWWLLRRGAPAKAAEFTPDADGRLSSAIPMPPRRAWIAGAIITLELGKPRGQPKGGIMLKGVLPSPQVLS